MAITREQPKSPSTPQDGQYTRPVPSSSRKFKRLSSLNQSSRSPHALEVDQQARIVKVQSTFFEVPVAFFTEMPLAIQEVVSFTSGQGLTAKDPIIFSGHTAGEFRKLLHAFLSFPYLELRRLTLDHFLTIAELSHKYCLRGLQMWSMDALALVVESSETPLRSASSQVFARMLKLALLYHRDNIAISIQVKWLARLHWHELPSIPAILFADAFSLRDLLSHAYYVQLVLMAPRISKSMLSDSDSPLSPKQNMHILCGYHSLLAYWKHLTYTPPEFERGKECTHHKSCLDVWKMRWYVACLQESSFAEVDVLARLRLLEQVLKKDKLLNVCMSTDCRGLALSSISRKRQEIATNLHHHFDLDF